MLRGLIGLAILALDIWAIINIFQSRSTTGKKVLWTLVILIFPLFGLIIWFFVGPKK